MAYVDDLRRRAVGSLDRQVRVLVYTDERNEHGETITTALVDVVVWAKLLEQGSALVLEDEGIRSDPSSTWLIRYDSRFVNELGNLKVQESATGERNARLPPRTW